MKFIGRQEELKLLNSLTEKSSASLVVVYGRRRIGKSRLIEEFGKNLQVLSFSGLPPSKGGTNLQQLEEFCRQIARNCKKPLKLYDDWGDAFEHLASHTTKGQHLILLDEISWMGKYDNTFMGKLKNAWDLAFKKNSKLIMVLCGSVSTWVERNILSNTGFHGRISLKLRMKELSIEECKSFWNKNRLSAHEMLKILAVTGGIPKYLEEIHTNFSADENIKQLCFSEHGILFNDFNQIFSNMLERDSTLYHKIVKSLISGAKEQSEILTSLNLKSGGLYSEYLDDLQTAGFIKKFPTWNLSNGKQKEIYQYQLSDNYLRFYLKYIAPNTHNIIEGNYKYQSISNLPGWSSIMALQFENLVLNNRKLIQNELRIYPDEIVCDNPYLQRQTQRYKGCQIDYLIHIQFGTLYVCEVKFSKNPIRMDIIDEMKEKISRLAIPKNYSVRPVLIHAGEVHDDVFDSTYFYKIINFTKFLN